MIWTPLGYIGLPKGQQQQELDIPQGANCPLLSRIGVVGVQSIYKRGLVEKMKQLACVELHCIQQVYREIQCWRNGQIERSNRSQAIPVQHIGSFVKVARFRGEGGSMDLLVDHIHDFPRKGPIGRRPQIDYRKVSLQKQDKEETPSKIMPYNSGRNLSR